MSAQTKSLQYAVLKFSRRAKYLEVVKTGDLAAMEGDCEAASTSKSTPAAEAPCVTAEEDKDITESDGKTDYLRSTVLMDVLNKKKMALLHSPDVVKFLQDQQRKKLKPHTAGSS